MGTFLNKSQRHHHHTRNCDRPAPHTIVLACVIRTCMVVDQCPLLNISVCAASAAAAASGNSFSTTLYNSQGCQWRRVETLRVPVTGAHTRTDPGKAYDVVELLHCFTQFSEIWTLLNLPIPDQRVLSISMCASESTCVGSNKLGDLWTCATGAGLQTRIVAQSALSDSSISSSCRLTNHHSCLLF